MTTVLASVAVTDRTGAFGFAAFATPPRLGLVSANRFQLKSTSSMSRTRPLTGGRLWNFTLGRSFKEIWRRSGENSQDSATSGMISLSLGGPKWPIFTATSRRFASSWKLETPLTLRLGSRLPSPVPLRLSVPPRLACLVVSTGCESSPEASLAAPGDAWFPLLLPPPPHAARIDAPATVAPDTDSARRRPVRFPSRLQ